jgi:steroid 5-alpha reductase family enzyme
MPTLTILLILFGLALLVSSLGFRKFVYFISVGYAFAIAAMALVTFGVYLAGLTWFSALHLVTLLAWGARLGFFVVRRERAPTYRKENRAIEEHYGRSQIPWPIQIGIWLIVSGLYLAMFLPGWLHAAAPGSSAPAALLLQTFGLLVMVAGLALESIADRQKSQFKALHPQAFCHTGLFQWVRCPNYLGEILFWVGSWLAGAAFFATPLAWIVAGIGLVGIVYIMLGSTRRLELAQEQRYGDQAEYQQYIQTVPVLFPYLPVYTLKNLRFVVG